MSLLQRLTRIVRSNVTAYRQELRESEDEFSDMMGDLNQAEEALRARETRARLDLRKLEMELVRLRERVSELGQQARQAEGEGRGETARKYLQRSRALEAEADTLQELIDRQRDLVEELGAAQQDLRTRISLLQRQSTELETQQHFAASQRRINELLEEAYEFDPAAVLEEIRGRTERWEEEARPSQSTPAPREPQPPKPEPPSPTTSPPSSSAVETEGDDEESFRNLEFAPPEEDQEAK
jgi:phage shock protein A